MTAYKQARSLVPSDPVVGPGTTASLDEELFHDPATADPRFGDFAPAVVSHRLEQFAARELWGMLQAPATSWRADVARFARNAITLGWLLGIFVESRKEDAWKQFRALRKANTRDAFDIFFPLTTPITAPAFDEKGDMHPMILLMDQDVMNRSMTPRPKTQRWRPKPFRDILVHELTHARNDNHEHLFQYSPTDPALFLYPQEALACGIRTGISTVNAMWLCVGELVARHVGWVVRQERAGTPGDQAVTGLKPENLAAAAREFFVEFMHYSADTKGNGYTDYVVSKGESAVFLQVALWVAVVAKQTSATDPAHQAVSTKAFDDAAGLCTLLALDPDLDESLADGLFPLNRDF